MPCKQCKTFLEWPTVFEKKSARQRIIELAECKILYLALQKFIQSVDKLEKDWEHVPVGNSSSSLSLNHAAEQQFQETAHQRDDRT